MDMSDLLGLKDEIFTHSITCMCVFAFPDPVKGIREIYRTLQVGGTAVVTTWKDQGFMSFMHRVQRAARPDRPVWQMQSMEWYTEGKLRGLMEDGEFRSGDVRFERVDGMFRGRDVDGVVDMLSKGELVKAMTVGWSDEEKEGLGEAVRGTLTQEERKNAGFPTVAWVAAAKK